MKSPEGPQCRCWYGGPMKMERNSGNCPIHGTDRYVKIESYWIHAGVYDCLHDIRVAMEKGGDVISAVEKAKKKLDHFIRYIRDLDSKID
jgi:hypothetical protein